MFTFSMKTTSPKTEKQRLGDAGEKMAARYLRFECGYKVLESNIRVGAHDEIDILAFDPRDAVLVFVEVRTRSSWPKDYLSLLSLTRRKRRALFRAARRWVATYNYTGGYRVDLVCIAQKKIIEHIREIHP